MQSHNRFPRPGHVNRRQVLGGLAGAWLSGMAAGTAQAAAPRERRQLVYQFLSGGASQLETWDPKPGASTGGPFGAVSTSAAGVQVSELLPNLARQMHRVAVVRSMNSSGFGVEHQGEGVLTGQVPRAGHRYPTLAEVAAAHLRATGGLPAHVELQSTDAFRYESTAPESPLGSSSRPLLVTGGRPAPAGIEPFLAIRDCLQERSVSVRDRERYGNTDLGRHLLQTRRLVEAGVPVVKVRHSWWDTHAEHFDQHRRLTTELDHALSALLQDLHERGLLESTLVVVASEFGRSPEVNRYGGRDHWPQAWSVALAGAGIRGGAVVGRTNADGREVVEREVTPAHLHATCLRALGIAPDHQASVGGEAGPLANPTALSIHELFG